MAAQYEIFSECPKTHDWVPTGVVVSGPAFGYGDPIYGTFNCQKCGNAHVWEKESSRVHLSAR